MPSNKNKKTNSLYACKLRSNSCEDENPSNRTTPNHNMFEALASDDESIPPVSQHDKQLSDLAQSISVMNTSINKIFGVLSSHSKIINASESHNDIDTPLTSSEANRINRVQSNPSSTPTTTDPDTDFKDYPDGVHGYDTLPDTAVTDINPEPTIDVKPPSTVLSNTTTCPVQAPLAPQTDLEATPIFGQNSFSVIVSSVSKVKYMSMESYLKDKIVASDSVRDIEKLYVDILMSLTFVFETDLHFLPPFGSLGRDIDFSLLFLRNIHGFTLQKCKSIFLRLGTILKSHLTSPSFICDKRCPKTAIVVRANPIATGWTLLEQILCDRLVLCGGIPDYDLDAIRTSLSIQPKESYIDFYVKTQNLLNEYDLCYRNKKFVPTTKIMKTFLSELNRAPDYVPFLTTYYERLITHISNFGDVDNSYQLKFTIHDVYRSLQTMNAPLVPSSLRPSISSILHHTPTQPPSPANSQTSYQEFIACLEVTIDEDCSDPTICAQQSSNRSRCQACLLGFHREVDCFLRGPPFQPSALQRRIKIYNEVNGERPPTGHKLREYNPQGKDADHTSGTRIAKKSQLTSSLKPSPKHTPFSNFKNKSNATRNASINAFQDPSEEDNQIDTDPTITSFISSQAEYNHDSAYIDDVDPTICSSISLPDSNQLPHNEDIVPFLSHQAKSAQDNTPTSLLQIIQKNHIRTRTRPSKSFMKQHCKSLEKLPLTYFEHFCTSSFHVDGGANCGAVNDKSLFYFYIETTTPIEQVGGSHLQSPGWGGILIQIDNNIHLLAPVYFCPQNPRNTLSTTSLVQYCSYASAIVNTNKYLEIVDTRNITSRIDFDVKNDLDYVTLSIMTLRKDLTNRLTIAAATLRRSP